MCKTERNKKRYTKRYTKCAKKFDFESVGGLRALCPKNVDFIGVSGVLDAFNYH